MSSTRGLLLVLLASLCLSTLPAAVKVGLSAEADPFQLLAPRMVLAVVILWLWMAVTRPHRLRIDGRGGRACALAGTFNGAGLALFYLALRRIDASVAIVIFSVYPAILLLMLRLRGEPVSRLDWLRLALAVAGVGLVASPGGSVDVLGALMALGCATLYALYMLVIHSRLVGHPVSSSTIWILSFVTLVALVARLLVPSEQALGPAGWAVVVWTAVIGTVIARLAMIAGIRVIGGGQTALLLPVETVMAVVWASLLLGERMSAVQALGAGLVVASVALAARRRGAPAPSP